MQTIYQQLEAIVSPHLENYREDLTKHDFKTLQEKEGKFIYGYRPTGTNIMFLPDSIKDYFKEKFLKSLTNNKTAAIEVLRAEMLSAIIWITYSNTTFLYFDGLKFRNKTKEQVTLIWREAIDKLCARLYSMNEGSETLIKLF